MMGLALLWRVGVDAPGVMETQREIIRQCRHESDPRAGQCAVVVAVAGQWIAINVRRAMIDKRQPLKPLRGFKRLAQFKCRHIAAITAEIALRIGAHAVRAAKGKLLRGIEILVALLTRRGK